MRIALLTSNEVRHFLLISALTKEGHDVLAIAEPKKQKIIETTPKGWPQLHFSLMQQAVKKELGSVANSPPVHSLTRGCFRDNQCLKILEKFKPDSVITYGCGIVGDPILNTFQSQVYGSHQGLPQYYRGSGSNFFAILEGNAAFTGISFHKLSSGIDTGPIIKQMIREPKPEDTYYSFSAKLIKDTIHGYIDLASKNFEVPCVDLKHHGKLFQRKDFNEQTLQEFYSLILSQSFKNIYDESIKEKGSPKLIGQELDGRI